MSLLGLAALAVMIGAVAGAGALPAQRAFAQANGTITIQKQLIGPTNAPVMGDLSGYVFTITPLSGGTAVALPPTGVTGLTSLSVAPGNYTITEQPRTGSTFVSITQNGLAVGSFTITSGQTTSLVATNQVQGTGSLTITKQIVDNNNVVQQGVDVSGFVFAITGPNTTQTLTTGTTGQLSLQNLAPGQYTITEQPRAGYTFASASVDGVPVANGQPFQLLATATTARQVLFQNRVGASTGTVRVTKEIVDASGVIQATADRSGFQFTIACGTSFSQIGTTDASGVATINNVPATGVATACTINEATRTNFTLVSIIPLNGSNIGQNGQITVTAGSITDIRVRNQGSGGGTGRTETVNLFAGCNNQSLTFPAGTPVTTVAAGISGTLEAIWRYDNAQGRFFGFSPLPGAPSDYNAVSMFLEPVFICMRTSGTFTRPQV